jgi:DegV family protein with EDD domain
MVVAYKCAERAAYNAAGRIDMEPQIIVDSCCDLTPTLRSVLRLSVASLQIDVAGRHYIDDGNIDTQELLADMKSDKNAPVTACPSPESYARLMARAPQTFVVTLSSKLSGSYNAACIGRDIALERDPTLQICVLDSETATAGETRIALMLRDLIDEGLSFEAVEARALAFIESMHTLFVLESLSNLVKNGRISRTAGLVGGMLGLRPLMSDNGHGEIVCLEKVRGTQNAMRRLVETVAAQTESRQKSSVTMVLSYCNCHDRAKELKKSFLEHCAAVKEVILVPTGGISTVYANDGGVVVAF